VRCASVHTIMNKDFIESADRNETIQVKYKPCVKAELLGIQSCELVWYSGTPYYRAILIFMQVQREF